KLPSKNDEEKPAGTDQWFSVRLIILIAMNIECHKSLIADPIQLENSKFIYRTDRWKRLDENCRNLIGMFEGKSISRTDVINAYAEYYKDNRTDWRKSILLT